MASARILVVEDSSTQAEALATLLATHGYEVVVAADGDIALDLVGREQFDLVLSDIVMQRVGGYELCRRIKRGPVRSRIPVVLVTSLTDPLDIVRGLECGADNYIIKPYDPDQLLARIRHALDRQSLRVAPRSTMGVEITFLGSTFNITSEREQILDLFLSSVEDVVSRNNALQERERELSTAHARLAAYAREVERRERLTSEKYRRLMQAATDGMFVLDLDGSILEANRRAAELVGEPLEDMAGQRLESFLSPVDAANFRDALVQLRSRGRMDLSELSIARNGGNVVYCELRASVAAIEDDHLVLAVLRDVTERKLALEATRQSRETLRALIDASPLAITTLDTEDRVTLWNQSAEQLFGWTTDEVLGKPLPIIPNERRGEFQKLGARVLAGERVREVDTFRLTRSGDRVAVSLWSAPLYGPDGTYGGRVMLFADVSERRALEQQLRQAQKMEAVGKLAGGIAHDFNNVLTAIGGYSDVLLNDPEQSEQARCDIQEIKRAAERATALTRQLLAFSRKQMLQPEAVNVNERVRELEKMLRRLIREDIELVLELEDGVGRVFVDPTQLEQVILNLVVNARDAMPGQGRITIATHSAVLDAEAVARFPFAVEPGGYVALAVQDNGEGIDWATQQHLFEPFFTTKKGAGTGLGLSTVYGIVKQSRGFVTVDSEPGRGTTMVVYLPLAEDAPPPSPRPRDGRMHEAKPVRGTETILLAEDEPALRRLVARVLQRAGYTVLEAKDGTTAAEIARTHGDTIHLLLTDMVMPDVGGAQLAEEVIALRPGVKTLYVSGYAEEIVSHEGSLHADAAFLEKPFSPAGLLQRVRELLAGD